jgi:phage shock protein B
MEGAFIVAMVFGSAVLILAIVAGTILMAIKLIKGGVSRAQQSQQADEARTIQEIFQGLSRMEDRVEALETILLEREKEEQRNEQA